MQKCHPWASAPANAQQGLAGQLGKVLFERQCRRETDMSYFHKFIPQTPSIAEARVGWSQGFGTQSRSPLWMARVQVVELSPLLPKAHTSMKLDSEAETVLEPQHSSTGCKCPKGQFNHSLYLCPLPQFTLLKCNCKGKLSRNSTLYTELHLVYI